MNLFKSKVIGLTVGGAFLADVTDTIVYPSTNTHYENVTIHYLTQGDLIDFTTGIFSYIVCLPISLN